MTAAAVLVERRQRIPEQVVRGRRLGRHINHDARSRRYAVAARAATAVTTHWERVTPILDQGDTGSCTGNATVGVLGSNVLYPLLHKVFPRLQLDETEALAIYSVATRLDGFDGTYPPDDTGSDGLSAAKAAKAAGLVTGYTHALGLDALVTGLQAGPGMVGVNWYDAFDEPDASGIVSLPAPAQLRGGHEFEVLNVDTANKMFECVNSWGDGWGIGGHFYVPMTVMDRLLREDGDATFLTPLTEPAPRPTPGTPDAVDAALVAAGNAWEPGIFSRITKAGKFRAEFDAWKAARGY